MSRGFRRGAAPPFAGTDGHALPDGVAIGQSTISTLIPASTLSATTAARCRSGCTCPCRWWTGGRRSSSTAPGRPRRWPLVKRRAVTYTFVWRCCTISTSPAVGLPPRRPRPGPSSPPPPAARASSFAFVSGACRMQSATAAVSGLDPGAGVNAFKPVRAFGLGQKPPPRRRSAQRPSHFFADVDRHVMF